MAPRGDFEAVAPLSSPECFSLPTPDGKTRVFHGLEPVSRRWKALTGGFPCAGVHKSYRFQPLVFPLRFFDDLEILGHLVPF